MLHLFKCLVDLSISSSMCVCVCVSEGFLKCLELSAKAPPVLEGIQHEL